MLGLAAAAVGLGLMWFPLGVVAGGLALFFVSMMAGRA